MKKIASLLTFLALVFGTMVAPAANADDASTAATTDSSLEATPEPQSTETASDPIAISTPEPSPSASVPATEPPLVPAGFIARGSADDIAVLWDPIDFQAATVPLVDTYIIRELLTRQTVEVAGTEQSYVFENLDSAIVYEFQIAARNSAGTSEFSEVARASIESSTDLKDISRLIVKYRDDVSPTLENGKPTGSESLDVDIDAGQEIGAGMRTVVLDDAITTNKADEVVDTLNDDPRIEWAEPDVFISLSAVNNDEPSGAVTLTRSGSTINQTVSNVGANYYSSIYGYRGYSDTWYKFVAPETRQVTASIARGGSLSDPILSSYSSSYQVIASNDDFDGYMPRIQFNVTAGQTYYIAFSSYGYSFQGTGNLVVSNLAAESPTPSAPTITSVTSQVNALTANWTAATTGSAATSFTATAYSSSSLTNAATTCSATSSARTCQLTGLTGGATYWVTVTATNSSGSATSSAVSGVAQLSRNSTPETAAELGTITYPFRTIVSNSDFPQTYVNSVGNSPAWYAFTAASSGLVDMRISPSWGTNYDPMLAVFAANNLSSRLAFDDDSNGSYKPRVRFNVVAGQRYLVAFSSYRSFSTGTGELTATFTSSSATVPGVPVSVSATSTQNSVSASWSAPTSDGGSRVTGYEATIYDDSVVVGQCQTTELSCTIRSLSPGTTYQLRVKASNAFGYGAESTATSVTTSSPANDVFEGAIDLGTVRGGYSGTISNLNGTTSASCMSRSGSYAAWYRFTAGSTGQATLEITSHQGMTDSMLFIYDADGEALGCDDDSAGGYRPRVTLSVTSGTTYYVALASWGSSYRGNANLQISLGADTPSAPQDVSVLSGNGSLVVNWNPPNFIGTSAISGYTAVAYSDLESDEMISYCSTDGSGRSCRIPDLENNTEYFVSVSATNSSGTGNSSGRISGTPALIRVPNSPAGVTVTTGVSLLQVSWQSVDTANIEPVIDYTATAYNSSGSAVNSCTTTATSCSIASLTSGTTYYVSVTARNTVGSGSPSSLVSGMAGYPPNWTPSDPSYVNGTLWGLNGRYGVSAPGAWTRTRGAASVVVAVIDTGGTSHPDLNANTVNGYDFISDPSNAADGNGWDTDASDPGDGGGSSRSSWHGTHVAGTIGAVSDSSGVVGVAPSTSLQHIRVLGTRGGSIADIASGIIWASGGSVPRTSPNTTPAKVINMSLGGPSYSCESTFQSAIDTAVSRGTTVVVAAGNDDEDAQFTSPANCDNVITVAAISSSGNRASFSNYGSDVDIAAPGVNIYSTINSGYSLPSTPSWTSYQGTSMAAPHVAGVVALMLASNPTLTPQSIEANIKSSSNVTPFAGNRCDSYWNFVTCGPGVINASRLLGSTYDPSVNPAPPTLTPTNPSNGAASNVAISRNQKISSKAFAARASISIPAKHKVKLTVVGSKKVCKISGGKVVALKPGACRVKVTVSGKVKVGKKMKMKKNSTTITVSVS